MIKYYYDLKRSNSYMYDKSQGTIIKLTNYTQSTKLTKKDILFILQSALVNISNLSSIKYYDEKDKGFLELSEHKPIDTAQIQDDFLIILLRTKDESSEFYKSNIKHISTIVSSLKVDVSANYHSLFGSLFQSKKAIVSNKSTYSEEEVIFLYSDPLVCLEGNGGNDNDNELQCNNRNQYYKKDIDILNDKAMQNKGRIINWAYYVVIPEVLYEISMKKPKILFISCNGFFTEGKYMIEVENKRGERVSFNLDELDSVRFDDVELLIVSNSPKEFEVKFKQLGIRNMIFILTRAISDDRKIKENDKLFIGTLYEYLFNGNSIKKSFDAAVSKVLCNLKVFSKKLLSTKNVIQSMGGAYQILRGYTMDHDSQSANTLETKEIKERYYLHLDNSNDNKVNNDNSQGANLIIFNTNKEDTTTNTKANNSHIHQIINQKLTYGRNLELYTLFNSNQRITIIYSEREVGKDNFLQKYSNYLLERRLYSHDMMIKIFIANRSITEHLIAKKISYQLKLSKWFTIREFYSIIKNLKCVFFIKFYNESLKDKEEIERTLTNFITKTITPKVYVIMVLNEVVQELKVNKFKLTKIKKEFLNNIIKERSLEYPLLYQALEDNAYRNIIMNYINGILFKVSQVIYFYSLTFVDGDIILSSIKESIGKSNLFMSILRQIALHEANDSYLIEDNSMKYMFLLFALSFIQEGLALDHLMVYLSPDLEYNDMIIWLDELVKHRFLLKNSPSYLGDYTYKLHHTFISHINTHLAPYYIKQWVKSSLLCISSFFIYIRHTLYLTRDYDFLDEYSSVIPHSFWVTLSPKYADKYNDLGAFKLDTDLEFVVREYEQMILLLFNTHREMIKDILIESIEQGDELYKETIELISIDIVTYYKFEDHNECAYWINYFSDLLKEMNYKKAYQRLLLFSYSFNNDLVSLSTMLEILNDNDSYMILLNIYQLVQRTKANLSLSIESLMLIYEAAYGYYCNAQSTNDAYIKILISYFLMKLCLTHPDLNSSFKQFTAMLSVMNDSNSEYFHSRIKIDFYIIIIRYYITIGNITSASEMIKVIETVSIEYMNRYEYKTIESLKREISSIRTVLDFNHIYFLHSNPLIKHKDNCLMYSSTKWYYKINKLAKYHKEICFKYLKLNQTNLRLVLDEFPKILVIICEDYSDDDEGIILENDNMEGEIFSKEALQGMIEESTGLASSIVILAFPNSGQYAQLLMKKDIKTAISFDYGISEVIEYQKRHPCLSVSLVIKSFTFYFIKKLIKGYSIGSAFDFAKRKMKLKYSSIYLKNENNSLNNVINLSNVHLLGEGNAIKPYQDDYEDSLLFNGGLIDISYKFEQHKHHYSSMSLLKSHHSIIGRLMDMHKIVSIIKNKGSNGNGNGNGAYCLLNIIGDTGVGKSLFVKEICNILQMNHIVKETVMFFNIINEDTIEKLTLMLDSPNNKKLIDSLVVFDLNYIEKDLIDTIRDLIKFNCSVIIVTKRAIPKVKLETVKVFELTKLQYDINKSSLLRKGLYKDYINKDEEKNMISIPNANANTETNSKVTLKKLFDAYTSSYN